MTSGFSKQKDGGEDATLVSLRTESSDTESVNVAALMKKLSRSVLPICSLILIFANIDRGNLGFVANQLCSDLNLSHTDYGNGASAFFAGLVFSRIPSNIAQQYFGAPVWLMTIMFAWGICAALLGFITHVHHFYVLRFLLGLAEGGAFPGVWYYVSEFFPDDHLTSAYTMVALALPLATALSGPLATSFFSLDGLFGIQYWRYMFFVEGIIPAIFAVVLYPYIPKSIDTVPQLLPEERKWLRQRVRAAQKASDRSLSTEIRMIFKNRPFWTLTVSGMMHVGVFAVILYWTALMIEQAVTPAANRDHGTCASSNTTSSLGMILTSLVFILSSVVTYFFGETTKNFRNRGPPAAWIAIVAGVAIGSWTLAGAWNQYLGFIMLTIAVSTAHANSALFVGLLVGQFDSQTRSTALAVYACISSFGSSLGPVIAGRLMDRYGDYNVASVLMGVLQTVGALPLFIVPDPLNKPSQKRKTSL